jgi:hypothetical protein
MGELGFASMEFNLGEVLRITKKAQEFGRDALEPWERDILDEFQELMERLRPQLEEGLLHPDSIEGHRLWEALPPRQREQYADWTPRQLLAFMPLLDDVGMKRPDDD